MVQSAAGYKNSDFIKNGIPLTIITIFVAVNMVNYCLIDFFLGLFCIWR